MRSLLVALALGAVALAAAAGQVAFSGQAPAQVVQVEMKEFAFAPKTLSAKPGAVRLTVVNKGIVEHSLVVTNIKNATTQVVRAGKTGTLDLTLPPGTYQIICDVPGHKEAGMTATLVVK